MERFQNFNELGKELQGLLEQNVKLSNDQNTLKIMWLYTL